MPEGQPSKFDFNATQEDSNGGNSTNILEIILELETREKPNTDKYHEESRWLIRVATQTLYKDIVSISSVSSTVPLAFNSVSGCFNGGANVMTVKVDASFGSDANGFTCIEDSFIPTPEKIGVVAHNQQWLRSASDYFDQDWNKTGVGTKITPETQCVSETYIKSFTCNLETRKLQSDGDEIDEECRYVLHLITGQEGTGLINIETIENAPSGAEVLGYAFAGTFDVLQLQNDSNFFGGSGVQGSSTNSTGAWTLIRQVIAATGNIGTRQFTFESHWISPSLWFPAKWTRVH